MKKSVLILKGALIILLYLGPYLTLNGQSEKVIFLNSGDQIQFNKLKWKQGRISYTDLDNSQKLLNYDDVNFIVNNKKVKNTGFDLHVIQRTLTGSTMHREGYV